MWDRLDRSDQPWLLVMDNADDPAILRDGSWLRTSPRGITLVTTRQVAPIGGPGRRCTTSVSCHGRTRRNCCATWHRRAAQWRRRPRSRIGWADCHWHSPFAGGYLAHQVISPWSMAEYGRALDRGDGTDPIDLLDQGATYRGDHQSRHLASSTWELSLDALRAQGLPEATRLMQLLGCWSHDPLPLTLLTGTGIGALLPRARVETALRGLLDHSLTRLVPGPPRCLRTHGVLLESIARGTPAEQRDLLVGVAAELLSAVLPDVTQPWAREDPPIAPFVPHTLALLRRAAQWTEVEQAAATRVLECALRLAVALHRAGDFASALSVGQDAVARGTRLLGPNHPAVIALHAACGAVPLPARAVRGGGGGPSPRSRGLHRSFWRECRRNAGVLCGALSGARLGA